MEMEEQNQQHEYGIDLRQFMTGRPSHYPSLPPQQAADLFTSHRDLPHPQGHHHYDMMMLMPPHGHLHEFRSDHSTTSACVAAAAGADNSGSTTLASANPTTTVLLSGLEGEGGGCSFGGGDGGTGRWPRQETLTLLEIRSRLDSKFKEANQKGPLWDEVSRIMSEEHGYQRSGKKCREKFENLYKYYKKTKEGKAGRQDGKHYRFFRQLEALYGDNSNNPISIPETQYPATNLLRFNANTTSQPIYQDAIHSQKLCDSLSLSNNSSEFDTSSSEDNVLSAATPVDHQNDPTEKRRKRRGGWKGKIKAFIDSQMKKLMERQEVWLEKLARTLEQKEQERVLREEEWKKQEAARIDREHKFWAKERAWIEARDAALMEALQKLTGRDVVINASSPDQAIMSGRELNHENHNENENETISSSGGKRENWPESEITKLMQLRNSLEPKFQQSGCMEEVLWEDIAAKMACLGYERSAVTCKEKWNSINNYLMRKSKDCNKKRKENTRIFSSNCYFQSTDHAAYNNPGTAAYCEINQQSSPAANSNAAAGNAVNDSCFRFFMGDHGENLWENYGLKLNNGDPN